MAALRLENAKEEGASEAKHNMVTGGYLVTAAMMEGYQLQWVREDERGEQHKVRTHLAVVQAELQHDPTLPLVGQLV